MKERSWRSRARGGRLRSILVGAAAAATLGAAGVGCGSMSKGRLERELLAVPKNAPMSTLERLAFEADLGDGLRPLELVYHHAPAGRSEGAAPDTPVVLVHGTPSTLFTWVEVVHGGRGFEGLAASRDVYAIEVVGHGIAPGDAGPYGFERCARFVNAAIRALGLDRVHLVGASYGGEFAWRAALNDPDRVESLVLIDSSGYERRQGDWLPEEVEMRENSLAKLGWLLNSRERIEVALAPHFDSIPPGRTDEFFLVCENASNWKAMIDLARDENGDRARELSRMRARTLVIWGADDVAYPLDVYGRRFARDIPGAQLAVLPATGHYPHEQRPAEVVRLLNEFFDHTGAP